MEVINKSVVDVFFCINTGRASNKHIERLIKKLLKENNFTAIAYAADGDSGYSPLVSQTINQ